MLIRAAEESFDLGMRSFGRRRYLEALAFFEAAVTLDRRFSERTPQARYLSYYGACLGALGVQLRDSVGLCRGAAAMEPYNPHLYFNLARVLLQAGKRRQAHNVLLRGLRVEPAHLDLNALLNTMGMRRQAPLPFLARSNRLNVVLGRMRAQA